MSGRCRSRNEIARHLSSESGVAIAGTILQLAAIATAATFSVGAARALNPGDRGQMVLVVQVGYFCGLVLGAGRQRSGFAGILPRSGASRPRKQISVLLAIAPVSALLLGASIYLVGALASIALAHSVVVRLGLQGMFIGDRSTWRLVALDGGTVVLAGSVLVALVILGTDSARAWTALYASSAALLPAIVYVSTSASSALSSPGIASDDRSHRRRLALGDVSIAVAQRVDRVGLGIAGRLDELGKYALVGSLTEVATVPASLVASVRSHPTRRAGNVLLASALVLSLGALAVILFWGDQLIVAVVGEQYQVDTALRSLLVGAAAAMMTYRLVAAEFLSRRETRNLLVAELAIGGCALVGYAASIPFFGARGAAASTCGAYIVGLLVLVARRFHRSSGPGARPTGVSDRLVGQRTSTGVDVAALGGAPLVADLRGNGS